MTKVPALRAVHGTAEITAPFVVKMDATIRTFSLVNADQTGVRAANPHGRHTSGSVRFQHSPVDCRGRLSSNHRPPGDRTSVVGHDGAVLAGRFLSAVSHKVGHVLTLIASKRRATQPRTFVSVVGSRSMGAARDNSMTPRAITQKAMPAAILWSTVS